MALALPYNPSMSAEPFLRRCPSCDESTTARVCPRDGTRTIAPPELDDDPMALVGRIFDGRYRVDAVLGQGGMGTVYRARQLRVDRPVALKILKPTVAAQPEVIRRFHNEARAASMLEHPNTIRLYDSGETEEGQLFIVTEILDGEPLSELLRRRGHLPIPRVVNIASQILRALAEAHAHGIIHRDLKPENIFLQAVHGATDFIKVLDFGVAKLAPRGKDWRRLTAVGTVVGTPLYMSPEQARGLDTDPRSDVYAVGAMLFELLVGSPPFMADSPVDIMMAHVQEPVPLMGLGASPRAKAIEAIVRRCLAKNADDRPTTAESLRLELEAALTESDEEPPDLTPLPTPRPTPVFSVVEDALPIESTGSGRVFFSVLFLVVVGVILTFVVLNRDKTPTDEPVSTTPTAGLDAVAKPLTPPRGPAAPGSPAPSLRPVAAPVLTRDPEPEVGRHDRSPLADIENKPASEGRPKILRPRSKGVTPKVEDTPPPLRVEKK
ncbi:MAG: serine/threonine protein kinase [Myxococcales bacterium]|nr:serine/threonine protein kinase [Myxococcales bacterium]